MTIENKIIINFTNSERILLRNTAALLSNLTCETEGIYDEISEKFNKAYELIKDLLDLEG